MRIGYSFWGFLGSGVTDTPDGGRSHRRTLIDGLIGRGHELVLLQQDRDRREAKDDLSSVYAWDTGLPDIDALVLEWRWPIRGRNDTPCGSPGHTCDLHRQGQLLDHYTRAGLPTLVWDKDLQLPPGAPLREAAHVVVCEAAVHPRYGAATVLFPVADSVLDTADPEALAAQDRDLALCYVGNQYDRDADFDRLLAPVASSISHVVAGRWSQTSRWAQVNFIGRVPFPEVEAIHRRSIATITLLPERYQHVGQMTQRLFEAVLAGCLPLVPTSIRSHHRFAPPELHVSNSSDVLAAIRHLATIVGSQSHVSLLTRCLGTLDQFRLSRQLDAIESALEVAGLRHRPTRAEVA